MTSNSESNAKQIKVLIKELHGLIAEEEGWEPKTPRDYMVLTWDKLKGLEGIPDRVTKLESNQGIFAGFQAGFTIIAAAVAGYFGSRQ